LKKFSALSRNFFNIQFGVRLAMAAVALVARLAVVLDHMDLFALAVFNDRSGHLGALNDRLADLYLFTEATSMTSKSILSPGFSKPKAQLQATRLL